MRCASMKLTVRFSVRRASTAVQRVAGGDEVDADQAGAGDVDDRRGLPSCFVELLQRQPDVAHGSWPDELDRSTPGSMPVSLGAAATRAKLVETSLTTESGGTVVLWPGAADADLAARRLPGRRRDFVGDAQVVDRRLVELVGAVGVMRRASSRGCQNAGSASRTPVGAASAERTMKRRSPGQPAHVQVLPGIQLRNRLRQAASQASASIGSAARPSRRPRAGASAATRMRSLATPSASRLRRGQTQPTWPSARSARSASLLGWPPRRPSSASSTTAARTRPNCCA